MFVVEVVDRTPNRVVCGGTCLATERLGLEALPPDRGLADLLPREAISVNLQLQSPLPARDVGNLGFCKIRFKKLLVV